MDNLVIIGNGFDLAHGMKTSYKDFTDWIIDGANQNKEEFESITRRTRNDPSQEHLISLINASRTDSNIFQGQFINHLITSVKENWFDIEILYFKSLNDCINIREYGPNREVDSVGMLNKQFRSISSLLKLFLEEQENKLEQEQKLNNQSKFYQRFFDSLRGNDSILSFNYTNTLTTLYNPKSRINYIHGNIRSGDMIFGFAPKQKDYQFLLEQDNEGVLENIKQRRYKLTDNEESLIEFMTMQGKQGFLFWGIR